MWEYLRRLVIASTEDKQTMHMVVGDFNAAREHMEIPMRARYQKCWYTKHADDALENFLEGLTAERT
eukprot:1354509-Prymnesium_polylepis.1